MLDILTMGKRVKTEIQEEMAAVSFNITKTTTRAKTEASVSTVLSKTTTTNTNKTATKRGTVGRKRPQVCVRVCRT